MTRKIVGYRTPQGFMLQPDITIVHEDGVSWHQEHHSLHVEDFRPLPEGYTLHGMSMDGLHACAVCGFLVEPVWSDGEVLDVWHDLVVAVTTQDDWDDELADGPEDIYRYVKALIDNQPDDAL